MDYVKLLNRLYRQGSLSFTNNVEVHGNVAVDRISSLTTESLESGRKGRYKAMPST